RDRGELALIDAAHVRGLHPPRRAGLGVVKQLVPGAPVFLVLTVYHAEHRAIGEVVVAGGFELRLPVLPRGRHGDLAPEAVADDLFRLVEDLVAGHNPRGVDVPLANVKPYVVVLVAPAQRLVTDRAVDGHDIRVVDKADDGFVVAPGVFDNGDAPGLGAPEQRRVIIKLVE